MKPIKIAQIGTMHDHAPAVFRSLKKNSDLFEFVGAAEICPGREDRLYPDVPHYTVEELLQMNDLEAVAIETEEERATEYAQMFAEKGLSIHMDKPGSPSIASFEKLVDTLEAHNSAFSLGYMYRFNPAILDLYKRIEAGELGEIYSVEAQMSVHHDKAKHEWLCKYPSGMLYFLGCHMVDLVFRILGEPEEIIPLSASTGQSAPDCKDFGFAVLKYKNGCSFVKSCAAEYNGFDRRQLVVCGTKGTAELRPLEVYGEHGLLHTPYKVTDSGCEKNPWVDNAQYLDTEGADRYDAMMRAFAGYVRGEKNPYTYDYEKRLFRVFMKCCGVNE